MRPNRWAVLFLSLAVLAVPTRAQTDEANVSASSNPSLVIDLTNSKVSRASVYWESLSGFRLTLEQHGKATDQASVVAALRDDNPIVRLSALVVLAATDAVTAVGEMTTLFSDESPAVQAIAVRSVHDIVKRYPEAGTHSIQAALHAKAADLYDTASVDLQKISMAKLLLDVTGDPRGYPDVLKALDDPVLRGLAVTMVSSFSNRELRDRIGKPVDWAKPVSAVVRDEKAPFTARLSGVTALQTMKTPEALEALRSLETVTSGKIQSIIKSTIRRYGSPDS